jgi:hypothetical protein
MRGDELHPASLAPERLAADCDTERLRRSGPGGQHRNKVETAIRLSHRPTGVRAEATERRSQAENRLLAFRRLRTNLALEVRRPPGPGIEPSLLWRARCPEGRIRIRVSHEDFPTMLAEALDAIAWCRADVRRAAEALGTSSSQLVKLLKKDPRALALVNRWRDEQGLGLLK